MKRLLIAAIFLNVISTLPARAETFFLDLVADPTAGSSTEIFALNIGDTVQFNFATPFGTENGSVVQVAFGSPGVQFSFSAGVTTPGSSTTQFTQGPFLDSSSPFTVFGINNQQAGCAVGCNFLSITANRRNFGSGPLSITGIGFGTNFTAPTPGVSGTFASVAASVASSAPEPATWSLMILAFIAIAMRMKTLGRSSRAKALRTLSTGEVYA